MVAEAVHGRLEQHLGNQASFWRRVGAEVNARERHLGAGAAVHGVQVMNKAFHGLKRLMFGVCFGSFNHAGRNLALFELFVVAVGDIVGYFKIEFFASKLFVFFDVFF